MVGAPHIFPDLSRVLSLNAQWAIDVEKSEPDFFKKNARGQSPKILWIGCADSRVPESVIMACRPGEIFVHRNIANQFHLDDDSAQSVLTFAIDSLGVEHVVVVGHTRCGGVAGAFDSAASGKPVSASTPLSRWLTPLSKIAAQPAFASAASENEEERTAALTALSEANARAQAANVCASNVIQSAWAAAREAETKASYGAQNAQDAVGSGRKKVYVHAWLYELESGRLRDLRVSHGPDGPVDMVLP